MKIGVCGLGLIGGSMAKAYKAGGHTVLAYDKSEETMRIATNEGIIDGVLEDKSAPECDILFVALYPEATIEYLTHIAPAVGGTQTVVMDLCGIKKQVCDVGFALAKKYGFTFVGGHPMAGTQFSGIKYAKETLFKNAPMVLVLDSDDDSLLSRVKALIAPAMLGKISVTSAEEHDAIIAFTSQLAHVVSNAYVKSPTARLHKGFSAGSYKDLTRVAWLNPQMWSELFLSNADNVLQELDILIESLQSYRKAIEMQDADKLISLLDEGRKRKEEVDG